MSHIIISIDSEYFREFWKKFVVYLYKKNQFKKLCDNSRNNFYLSIQIYYSSFIQLFKFLLFKDDRKNRIWILISRSLPYHE